jgi:RNA polymerase sigma factor (sigma-70 family)
MTPSRDDAFATVLREHLGALYRAAYRLTGNRPDAEDLVQEVCLRAHEKAAAFAGIDAPKSWLLRVQYRVFLSGARRTKRSPLRRLPDDTASWPSAEPGPEALADSALAERRFEQAWRALEKQQRALLALHAEGYSLREIEQITDLSTDALKARLYRARVRLGKLLGEHANATAPILEG